MKKNWKPWSLRLRPTHPPTEWFTGVKWRATGAAKNQGSWHMSERPFNIENMKKEEKVNLKQNMRQNIRWKWEVEIQGEAIYLEKEGTSVVITSRRHPPWFTHSERSVSKTPHFRFGSFPRFGFRKTHLQILVLRSSYCPHNLVFLQWKS